MCLGTEWCRRLRWSRSSGTVGLVDLYLEVLELFELFEVGVVDLGRSVRRCDLAAGGDSEVATPCDFRQAGLLR